MSDIKDDLRPSRRADLSDNNQIIEKNSLIFKPYILPERKQKFLNMMKANIKKSDIVFPKLRFKIQEVGKKLDYKGKDLHKVVYELCEELRVDGFTQYGYKEGQKVIERSGFVAGVTYYPDDGSIELHFTEIMREHLLQIDMQGGNYTVWFEMYGRKLKGMYTNKYYRMLKAREGLGEIYFSLDELRENFCLKGTNKYIKFKDFRVWIIDKVKKELKEKTDIYFEYEPVKEGRRVVGVNHKIFKNNDVIKRQRVEIGREIKFIPQELFDDLLHYGLNESEIIELDELHCISEGQIRDNVAYSLEQDARSDYEVKNFGRYLLNAIIKNFAKQSGYSLEKEKIKEEKKRTTQEEKKQKAEEKAQVENLENEYNSLREKELERYIEENGKDSLYSAFIEQATDLQKGFIARNSTKDIMKVNMLRGSFSLFFAREYLPDNMKDFKTWAKSVHNLKIKRNSV